MSDDQGYGNPELLAETQWLAERLNRPDIRVVDMGTAEAFLRAHIPGAVSIGDGEKAAYLKDSADKVHLMQPEAFAELMGSLGIHAETLVVAYDSEGGHTAARLWWSLAYYGHTNCKVLNGGINKWILEKRAVSMEPGSYPSVRFNPKIRKHHLAVLDDVLEAIEKDSTITLDVRSDREWKGSNDRGNKRGGHLPNAIHVEWLRSLNDPHSKALKPASELRELFWNAGVTANKDVITY